MKLHQLLKKRRDFEIANLAEMHSTAKESWEIQKNQLTLQVEQERTQLDSVAAEYHKALQVHGVES